MPLHRHTASLRTLGGLLRQKMLASDWLMKRGRAGSYFDTPPPERV